MEMEKESEKLIVEINTAEGVIPCEVIAVFDVEEKSYIALLPQAETENEILLFEYNELSNDEVEIFNIEDGSEYEKVVDKFDSLIEAE